MKNVFEWFYPAKVKWVVIFGISQLMVWGNAAMAQTANLVPFKHQVGTNAPDGNIFRIRGDFTIIGNTNLTLSNYDENIDNSLQNMVFVDVDGDPLTFNSSSATLLFSEENGADQQCSEILYAGLYWAGKAKTGSELNFPLTKEIQSDTKVEVFNEEQFLLPSEKVSHSSFTLSYNQFIDENERYFPVYYLWSNDHPEISFRFSNDLADQVTYRIGDEDWRGVTNLVVTVSGDTSVATFDVVQFEDKGITLSVHTLKRSLIREVENFRDEDFGVGLTADGSYFPILTHTVTVDKRKVKLKGPGDNGYTEINAQGNRIMYPHNIYADIYVGYADITNLVKSQGAGEYTVADMALAEGYGDQSGFFGNWGMIVIYQNSRMNWRDVTVFDGYSYVRAEDLQESVGEIEISGFGTVNKGSVNLKLGVMAGEGDRKIEGDFLEIIDQKGSWVRLNHDLNSKDNFFNSSIYTPVRNSQGDLIQNPRNPNLLNNTGTDIVLWDVPNPDNEVIANGQTSTRFRYGTKQDLYVIYALAFSVPSFVPDIKAHHYLYGIDGNPVDKDTFAKPGEEMTFKIDIRNSGSEESDFTKITIPLPATASFVGAQTLPVDQGTITFDPEMGVNGAIIWEIGEIPITADPDEVIRSMEYTLKITEDCSVLGNFSCEAKLSMEGSISGVGRISESAYSNLPLIIGFLDEECAAEAIYGGLEIPIEGIAEFADRNCQGEDESPGLGPINLPIFCQTDAPTELSSIISPSVEGFNIYFFTEEEGGTPLTSYLVNTALPSTEQIWVAQGLTPTCTGIRQPVAIIVIPKAREPRVQQVTVCQFGLPIGFQVTGIPGFQLNYYPDANPESLPFTEVPEVDPLEEGVYSVWVSHFQEGMCESNRVQVRVIVEDCSLHPAIEITKTADVEKFSMANETITYTLEVTNPRNVRLYQVNVYDGLTDESWTIPYLYENSSHTFTTTYVTKARDLDSRVITNYAYAWGTTDKDVTVEDQAFLEIPALIFPEGFLNYVIRPFPENCDNEGDAKGKIEIGFGQLNQTGTYSLIRQTDNLLVEGEFQNRRSVQIAVPQGTYTLTITDPEGNNHAVAGTFTVDKQEFVTFTIPEEIEACYPYFFIPASTETLTYRVIAPNGSEIPRNAQGDYKFLVSGNYRILGTDPDGKKCPVEKLLQANIETPQGINLELAPYCREDVFTTIGIGQDVGDYAIRWYQLSSGEEAHLPDYDDRTTLTVVEVGSYRVTLTDNLSCIKAMEQLEVTQSLNTPPSLESLYTICTARNLSIQVEVAASFLSCQWFLEGIIVGNGLKFSPGQQGRYSLLATDRQGCEFMQDFEVEDACDAMIRYPTAIRPGDPSKSFVIYPDNLTGELEVFIQNRWGELIYYCEDKNLKVGQASKCLWDGTIRGKIVPNGDYIVFIRYRTKEQNLLVTEKGVITVIN